MLQRSGWRGIAEIGNSRLPFAKPGVGRAFLSSVRKTPLQGGFLVSALPDVRKDNLALPLDEIGEACSRLA